MILISLRFDDGTISQYTEAFEYMRKYKMPGTIYIIGKHIQKMEKYHKQSRGSYRPGYLNLKKVREMQSTGWEIGYHSWSHDKNWIDREDYEREIDSTLLEKNGIRVSTFALPHSVYNNKVLRTLGKKYRGIVGIPANYNFNSMQKIHDNKLLYSYTVTMKTTLDDLNTALKHCIEHEKYPIFLFHKIEKEPSSHWSFSVDLFQKFIEILHTLEKLHILKVVTIRGGISRI